MQIKIYGCRASIPVSRRGSRYGGNTSCMTVKSKGEMIVLDAGSGLMCLQEDLLKGPHVSDINILVSHLHLDHIVGLSTFERVLQPDGGVRIYTCSRDDRPLDEQVFGAFAPPYWPVVMKDKAYAQCLPVEDCVPFRIGVFKITPFLASHPDKTYSYHITDGRKNLVHLLDSEINNLKQMDYELLLGFCRDADAVVFDAAYSPEDYLKYKGWGHSTVEDGVILSQVCGCKKIIFAHHGQIYDDNELDRWHTYFPSDKFILAKDGLEFEV